MHDDHDIVARVTSSDSGNSIGALAGYIARSCGHVSLDQRILAQGYRFYPWMSDEIPHFFNKRFTTGNINLAITLQAGLNLDGDDPFENCSGNAEAREILDSELYESSLWLARITVGTEMFTVAEIAENSFIARHPSEFRLISDELVSLGIVQEASCPMCAEDAAGTPQQDDQADAA